MSDTRDRVLTAILVFFAVPLFGFAVFALIDGRPGDAAFNFALVVLLSTSVRVDRLQRRVDELECGCTQGGAR